MSLGVLYPITGIVRDAQGNLVDGANIEIIDTTSAQGTAITTTNAQGKYIINVQDYVTDGDTIQIHADYGGEIKEITFTLVVSDGITQHNLILNPTYADDANATDALTIEAQVPLADDANASDTFTRAASSVLTDDANATDSVASEPQIPFVRRCKC